MDSLIENITGYVETRIELMKIEMKEELAKGLSKLLVIYIDGVSLYCLLS